VNLLDHLSPNQRLFTYKVAHDGGSAPNPYHGVCTLGICKPAIRRVARPGDVVVGLACAPDEGRIIYCMVVDHVLPWKAYIQACSGHSVQLDGISSESLKRKVPTGPNDPGDCIWTAAANEPQARPSWSKHSGSDDYRRDVQDGENVIISSRFWYFGDGEQHAVHLESDKLKEIIPGRGHRSNANGPYRATFVDFFNRQLDQLCIPTYGKFGEPALGPGLSDEATRSRCRVQEKEFDAVGEEMHGNGVPPTRC
jgi:hypothetical protein